VRDGANFAGAMGPMQFLAGTWAAYSADGDDDGVRNVYDPDDAVFGAARYLCASGGAKVETLRSALWAYNHADWYVEMVLELAAKYTG
jgi:membrane-bound lytic murein transglycosylase B